MFIKSIRMREHRLNEFLMQTTMSSNRKRKLPNIDKRLRIRKENV